MKIAIVNILATACVLVLPCSVWGQAYEDILRLRGDLLANYSKDIIPVVNTSTQLDVLTMIIVYTIPELDPVIGSVRVTLSSVATWTDEKMRWNPADYGGLSSIHFKDTQVWYPPIGLGTPLEVHAFGGTDRIKYFDNGTALWKSSAVLDSSCYYNMRYWPFDKQTCMVRFYVMDYSADQVMLLPLGKGINTDVYTHGAEWILEGATAEYVEIIDLSVVQYYFKLKRESLFYVLTLILPLFSLGSLTSFVFLLPSDSGERVGFSITILLSIAVFLTMITEVMPKSASPISLVCVFVMVLLSISMLTTVFAIYSLRLYHRDPEIPVGKWYKKMYKLANKNCWSRSKEKVLPVKIHKGGFDKNSDAVGDNRSEVDDGADCAVRWTDVSKAFDKLMFITSSTFCVVPSVIFFIYISAASDYAEINQ